MLEQGTDKLLTVYTRQVFYALPRSNGEYGLFLLLLYPT